MNDALTSPILSYNGLKRSHRAIVNLHDFYFPLYNLDSDFLVRNYPILVFTEGFVYELDRLTEAAQDAGNISDDIYAICAPVQATLESQDLWDDKIEAELRNLVRYFQLETRIMLEGGATLEDLIAINGVRSSDIRMLHRILCRMATIPYDERVFEAVHPMEMVFEIEDDIGSFEEDVQGGRFNTLAILKNIFGDDASAELDAMTSAIEATFRQRLSKVRGTMNQTLASAYDTFRGSFPRQTGVVF
ncbi:MAG: hypothetical protein JXR76_32270 [Deltaproteobacteria bacterium]|nr:hypothetical protein [Deltaproteobacteria bacterium]